MKDSIEIEILEDGTISFKTKEISQKQHTSAEEFLDMIKTFMGGDTKTTPNKKSYSMQLRNKDRIVTNKY